MSLEKDFKPKQTFSASFEADLLWISDLSRSFFSSRVLEIFRDDHRRVLDDPRTFSASVEAGSLHELPSTVHGFNLIAFELMGIRVSLLAVSSAVDENYIDCTKASALATESRWVFGPRWRKKRVFLQIFLMISYCFNEFFLAFFALLRSRFVLQ